MTRPVRLPRTKGPCIPFCAEIGFRFAYHADLKTRVGRVVKVNRLTLRVWFDDQPRSQLVTKELAETWFVGDKEVAA